MINIEKFDELCQSLDSDFQQLESITNTSILTKWAPDHENPGEAILLILMNDPTEITPSNQAIVESVLAGRYPEFAEYIGNANHLVSWNYHGLLSEDGYEIEYYSLYDEIINLIENTGTVYKHFKGDYYLVLGITRNSLTDEFEVLYKALYGKCKMYTRPIEDFLSILDNDKIIEYGQQRRFQPYRFVSVKDTPKK